MPNDLFASRYELLQEMPPGAGGRLFEARDVQTGERVALKVFRKLLAPNSAERAKLEAVFGRLREAGHERVIRFHGLWLDDGYLVREWMHGFSLLDLLRKRREVPAEEMVCLLEGIASALDFAVARELAPAGAVLPRLYVAFAEDVDRKQLARWRGEPLEKWPDFSVKLNPLSMSAYLPVRDGDPMTTVAPPLPKSAAALAPATAFALMLYELLGGPHLSRIAPRYAPLPALNEAGNAVLRAVIEQRRAPASCTALWDELTAASAVVPVRRKAPLTVLRRMTIPDGLLDRVQVATTLQLTPEDPMTATICLVARPVFRIGRSAQQADFVARVLPATPENEKLTREIGRVHVTATLKGARLVLTDGNGAQPSTNGSSFNGVPLSSNESLPLERAGLLALFKNYALEVQPMTGAREGEWEIANERAWCGPELPTPLVRGAVLFQPRAPHRAARETVWLFTRVEFSLEHDAIVWREHLSASSSGAFLHHRGQFWLANLAGNPEMHVEDTALGESDVAPLISGQKVVLAGQRYTVEAH